MKIDTQKVLQQMNGKPVKEGDGELRLGRACSQALASALEGDEKMSADKVLARWKLAQALYSAEGEHEITPEQATEIRGRAGRVFQLVVAGQIIEALQ